MSEMQLNLEEALDILKTAPEDKKALIVEKLVPVFEHILKTRVALDGMFETYFERVEPGIGNQIKAIDKRTEESANAIIDSCERITKATKDFPDAQKKPIQNEINAIFQASNFQDLVSQHANEIKLLLEDLSVDMSHSQNVLTQSASDEDTDPSSPLPKSKRSDAHLLNGPTTIFDD